MFEYLTSFIGSILSFIYDIIVSRPVTSYTYHRLLQRLKYHSVIFKNMEAILDVGVGTGTALNCIVPSINKDVNIVGVDIDEHYVNYCKKLFEKMNNVSIFLQDFNEFDEDYKKFDIILFSSSFMLMPDKRKTLEKARKLLKKGGKIYFILTLFEKKKKIVEKFKPMLKYLLTIDFGEALTEKIFFEILEKNELKVTYKERIHRNFFPCFRLFRYFLIEAEFN